MSSANLESPLIESRIKAQAYGLGFDLVGITQLGPAESAGIFEQWLDNGYGGTMDYLSRGAAKRRDTRLPFDGAVSAIVVALNYGGTASAGPIARYARGNDYHDLMWSRLDSLHAWINDDVGAAVRAKSYVDTGPILERDLARKAGIGWFGKNTNLINPGLGSFFFIGALLVDLELVADPPFEPDRCGTCTRCLEACPTDAFVAPGVLDATRCISYHTIENRGEIPLDIREKMGGLVYGCDICQDVCPWNISFARELTEPGLMPRENLANADSRTLAHQLLGMTDEDFRVTFKGSAMKRAKLRGLKRNAAVVLGNTGTETDIDILARTVTDSDELVSTHSAWAIERIRQRHPTPMAHSIANPSH